MEQNTRLVTDFYTAFANHDTMAMSRCYHPEISFTDPVFGTLKGNNASAMWEMLIKRSNGKLDITFSDVKTTATNGSAKWTAAYCFSKTNRNVVNNVNADFKFRDGLIISHTDDFNLWNWSRQALGFSGLLLGWTGFMKRKIRTQAAASLEKYLEKVSNRI